MNLGDVDRDVLFSLSPIGRLLSFVGLLTESLTDLLIICLLLTDEFVLGVLTGAFIGLETIEPC